MAYNESDGKTDILDEIRMLKKELADLEDDLYYITSRRKFIKHRISDLEYELR